jgi:formiminoglutamase
MLENHFEPPAPEIFFTKDDVDDPRLGNLVIKKTFSQIEKQKKTFALLGYPDDEGIKLNGGRPGSAAAPDTVRRFFYKFTPSLYGKINELHDFGNLKVLNLDLSDKHSHAQTAVTELLNNNYSVMTVGGGHDYGYPDLAAFCEHTLSQGKRPFILNFDAHFDVRPDTLSAHSGTGFYKLLTKYSEKIDFFEIGIQDWCNSRAHAKWLKSKGAHVITLDDILINKNGLFGVLESKVFSKLKSKSRLALSVCLDVFSSAFSPGASQVFPTGLEANEFLKNWIKMLKTYEPKLAGFYETSPAFDQDGRTAKLTAILLHQFISQ